MNTKLNATCAYQQINKLHCFDIIEERGNKAITLLMTTMRTVFDAVLPTVSLLPHAYSRREGAPINLNIVGTESRRGRYNFIPSPVSVSIHDFIL